MACGRPRLDTVAQEGCVGVCVTLTPTVFNDMESARNKVDMSRSEFVREALKQYIRGVNEFAYVEKLWVEVDVE